MNNSTLLALTLTDSYRWLDQVVANLTPGQYAWQPEGSANPINKLHAHTLSALDFWVNMMALQKPLLWLEVAAKTGLPPNPLGIWATDHPINLEDMQAYGQSLIDAAVPAIQSLPDDALNRELDTRFFGMQDVSYVLRLASIQLALHTGEISATKGLQGLQGLPV